MKLIRPVKGSVKFFNEDGKQIVEKDVYTDLFLDKETFHRELMAEVDRINAEDRK